MLTGMASKDAHRKDLDDEADEAPHYLREHLSARIGWNQTRLAKELGTSAVNVSRWLSKKPGKRGLTSHWRRKIEHLWALRVGALLEPPQPLAEAPTDAFLAGLSKDARKQIIDHRNALAAQEAKLATPKRRR
jgi:hypothetical protein